MKKIIGILGVAVFAVTLFASTNVNSLKDIDLASLITMNTASAEFDPIASCNSWCTSGVQCVLVTNVGFNIYCNGWDRP
ncbi:MAG: hypothetical protein IZT56_10270 [Bacteroidetes bacterium]|nr:hypothetical protein [Bacteroidota bacterium]